MTAKNLSPEHLSERRLEAVRLRLDGRTIAETVSRTGLSAPTVSAAWKAFRDGGWEAVPLRVRGRKAGQGASIDAAAERALVTRLTTFPPDGAPAWSPRALADALETAGHAVSPRAIDRWLAAHDLQPAPLALDALAKQRGGAGRWYRQQVQPLLAAVRQAGGAVWQGGVRCAQPVDRTADRAVPRYQFFLHGKRGVLLTVCSATPPKADAYVQLFSRLSSALPARRVVLLLHGAWVQASPELQAWLAAHADFHLITVPPDAAAGRSPVDREPR